VIGRRRKKIEEIESWTANQRLSVFDDLDRRWNS
jgi:hypothetical protein